MGINANVFDTLFGGDNVRSTKSTNTANQAFIDPDADVVVNAKFRILDGRITDTQNSQNNPENRYSEGFFTQADNRDFSRSAHFSQREAANIFQFYAASDRSFTAGSTKYGSSGSSSFSPSNKAAGQVGRQFASIA